MTDYRSADTNTETPTVSVRVFVNYRRSDTKHVAGRLRDMIIASFGDGSVFVDVESIEPGLDYVSAIDTAVSGCDVMLVLIGDEWLEPRNDQGVRRIDDPTDRLRIEIEAGLRNMTRVIPVLVDTATMPKTKDLPTALVPLSRHQAIRLRHESFRSDAEHLLSVVERVALGRSGPSVPAQRAKPSQRPPDREQPPVARWVALGLLVATLLTVLAFRDEARIFLAATRVNLPGDGPWVSLLWLLPSLPVVVAAWLVATGKRSGVAAGCIGGAAVWVAISWLAARAQPAPATTAHFLLIILLLGGGAALVVAAPELRQTVRANRWDRALIALVLMVAAIVLRTQAAPIASIIAATGTTPVWDTDLGQPSFWREALIPLSVCLPAAVLLLNRAQRKAFTTLAFLQLLFPVVLALLTFDGETGRGAGVAFVLVRDLVFLAGGVAALLAVRAGQRQALADATG